MSDVALAETDEGADIPIEEAAEGQEAPSSEYEGEEVQEVAEDAPQDDIDPVSGLSWEEQAQKQGWNPEYDGPNARSAQEFVEFGRNVIEPQLGAEKKKLESQVEEMRRMLKVQEQANQRARERDRQEYESQLAAAVQSGDLQAVNNIRAQVDQLDEQYSPKNNSIPEDARAWQNKNTWYGSSKHAAETSFAAGIAHQTTQDNPHFTPDQIRGAVDTEMQRRFPELYSTQEAPKHIVKAPKVVGAAPRRVTRKKSGPSADDLPAEAKAMADQYISEGVFKDREEYAAIYFENDK